MRPPAVDVRSLTHFYGDRQALQNVTLSVQDGSLFGVLGPNGGGKTTLFRILATRIRPSNGRAFVFGEDVTQAAALVRRMVGVVFQAVALDDEMTVLENLHTHAALFGMRRSDADARLDTLLPLFELEDRANDRVDRLSGGLQRRADLVRGLLHSPPMLLLDEPTTGLDPGARHIFWEMIERVRRREGTTILLATHSMEEADRCSEVAILDRGRIVASGSPSSLKRAIGEETLWIECSDANDLSGRIADHFGVGSSVIGSRVQVAVQDAHELLPSLYDAFGPDIHAATIRRPTLEDVFMVHTGRGIDEADAPDEKPAAS